MNLCMKYDCWEKFDSSVKGELSVFSVSEDGTEAVIDNRVTNATLKKYVCEAEITPGITYQISVPFREFDTRGLNSVYGMVRKPEECIWNVPVLGRCLLFLGQKKKLRCGWILELRVRAKLSGIDRFFKNVSR